MTAKNTRAIDTTDDAGPPSKKLKTELAPSHTIYLKNLNDKLNKKLLKEQLYILFSTYGEVIDIIVLKNRKMRGQAHVVFTNYNDASVAMRSLQDDVIFGKKMVIEWSKTDGKIIEELSQ